MPGLIEGGDWNHRGGFQVRDNPLYLLVAFSIVFVAIWRKRISHRRQLRRAQTDIKKLEELVKDLRKDDNKESNKRENVLGSEDTSGDSVINENKTEVAEGGENGPPAEKKPRRKRGQRGGKNNKRKVGFAEPTTEGEDDDHGENNEDIAPPPLLKDPPRELPQNDQGNYTIDGLTVTDKLLGTTFFLELFLHVRFWKPRNICI